MNLFIAVGAAPYYTYFPMFLVKIDGWFKYFGQYGGYVAVTVSIS